MRSLRLAALALVLARTAASAAPLPAEKGEHLKNGFYDQRGMGRSAPLTAGQSCTLADQIADLDALRAHLFKQVFPEGIERQEAVGFGSELGDKDARTIDVREYLAMLFYAPENRDHFLTHASELAWSREINQRLNTDLGRFDLGPELRKLRMRFTAFERSGHLPFFEEPDAFAKVVEAFLKR